MKDFNFLANIKIKIAETEFKNIDNAVAALAADNLTCLSTLASVVLIIDNLSELQINDILSFKKYIDKFSIPVIVQINSDKLISLADLTKLKLISTSVQLRTSNFNPEIFNKNIHNLTNNDVRISIKLDITKDNWKDVYNNIPLIDSNISIKLYFIAPYASVIGYTKIQNKFEEYKFENVRIATCSHNRFNKNKARITLAPMDCEASRYSVYVENRTVYPCEYNKQFGIELETCAAIPNFWEHKKMIKFRKQIIENNFCKL